MEAFWRAVGGIGEDRYFRGDLVGSVTRYSDRLLMFLLEARRPSKFGSGAEAQAAAAEACVARAEPRTQPARPARRAAKPSSRRTGFRSGLRSSACLNRYGDGTTPTTSPFVPSEAAKISLNVCVW